MTELPAGWFVRKLGDVASIQGGIQKQPKRAPKLNVKPFLRVANVTASGLDLTDIHSVELFDGELSRYSLRKGDLLVVEGNGSPSQIGRAAVWDGSIDDCVHQNHLIRVRPGSDVLPSYLGLVWNSPRSRDRLTELASSSSGLHTLSVSKLKRVDIPVPPLGEQRRIVELLDDHLSRLDAANESLELAARRAERLWLSAVTRLLFLSGEQRAAPLIDLLDLSVGGVWGSAPGEDECDVRVLRVTEMSRDGSLEPSTAVLRSISKRQLDKRELRAGDLLLEKSGGGPNTPVGRVGLVGELAGSAICSNFMQLMRPNADRVLPEYLHVYLQSFHLRGGTQSMQTASTNIRNIKASEYVRLSVPIPAMDEQARIVRELEEMKASRQRLSSGLLAATRRGVGLKRALLEAAFSGRLTGRSSDLDRVEELAEANA
ncbi:restriction endonuclease subunit S [Modestobacter roseus]|uniref:restriction endonuclease subunit S n=1 Tax=Modestobacter roseus TaxID=1181884 RepID=UPI001296A1F2|nr:restriction endonuclease subunit S [Modestobacter roseus]MQA35726.1 restriction endonuclease subunit S [Modestobacter roseus]